MDWPVIGHDWAVTLLRRSLDAGRLAHAYLLTGPPQVGKTTLARALAQALQCPEADPPCGRCPACHKVARGTHPDVRVIVGEAAGGGVKIEQVRNLQHEAQLAPYEGRYRVFVLRQMDQATLEASNSLLKTLEEPPSQVVLILTAVDTEALPRTVVSRCQRLDLRPVALHMVAATLRERGIAADTAQLLARLSGGRVGWALQAAQDASLLQRRQEVLDRLVRLLAADRVERLESAQALGRDTAGARQVVEMWIGWWRDLVLCRTSPGNDQPGVINIDRLEEIRSMSRGVALPRAVIALQAMQAAASQLEANVNPRLALEGLLLQLPRIAET